MPRFFSRVLFYWNCFFALLHNLSEGLRCGTGMNSDWIFFLFGNRSLRIANSSALAAGRVGSRRLKRSVSRRRWSCCSGWKNRRASAIWVASGNNSPSTWSALPTSHQPTPRWNYNESRILTEDSHFKYWIEGLEIVQIWIWFAAMSVVSFFSATKSQLFFPFRVVLLLEWSHHRSKTGRYWPSWYVWNSARMLPCLPWCCPSIPVALTPTSSVSCASSRTTNSSAASTRPKNSPSSARTDVAGRCSLKVSLFLGHAQLLVLLLEKKSIEEKQIFIHI